ncbi:pleckstrin homology domain-containing family B member 2 isoform X5 [Crocuta crocuta]
MMTRLGRVLRIRSTCQWTASTSAWGTSVGIFSLQMGSQKTVCCRLFAEMGKLSVFVQKVQMIVWPGNLHSRIPGQTQLTLAQKSCMMRQLWLLLLLLTQPMPHRPLRHMAMVRTMVHILQELKLSMLQMDRLMLHPTSTHMQVNTQYERFSVHLLLQSDAVQTASMDCEGFCLLDFFSCQVEN